MQNFTKLTNAQYDRLKWLILRVVPALTIAISGIGVLLGWDVTIVVGILGIVTTFLSSILGISTKHYEEDNHAE